MLTFIKKIIKNMLPGSVVDKLTRYRHKIFMRRLENLTAKDLFTTIYEENVWRDGAPDTQQKYYSGSGSHAPDVVKPYIDEVTKILQSMPEKPSVLDLGCGDFAIGSQLVKYCKSYVACDIVEPLIEYNRQKYAHLNAHFCVLDIIEDDIPETDIIILRQVLQHLTNDDIQKIIPKFYHKCKKIIVSEDMGKSRDDIKDGSTLARHQAAVMDFRGVVLTDHPFNFDVKDKKSLCRIGNIETIVYNLS